MSRLKLTIAYDGRPFGGWQVQPNTETVQQVIETAIADIAKTPIRIHASGRTDAGVHALGQVAHFDVPSDTSMNPYNWVPALNSKLPSSIRMTACEEVSSDFHAQYDAIDKTYTYDLCLAPVVPPLQAGLVWHLPVLLNPQSLQEALDILKGKHDFQAFAAKRGNETENTCFVREIYQLTSHTTENGYRLTFTGNGFLYKMVRLLTGAIVHTAQGRISPEKLQQLLDQPKSLPHGRSPHCAPADGLILQQVTYPSR